MILVDDAEGRADLAQLLDALAAQYTSPAIRVILLVRSAAGLTASLASQLEHRHEWIMARAPVLELQPEGGREDRERWFAEAVTAFAAERGVAVPALPYPARPDISQPILVLQAQALLTVLGTVDAEGDPRRLSFGQIAAALMKHEKRRWAATAATWSWGTGDPLSQRLQERSIAALVLLGPDSDGEAEQILRRIPELRDATAERLIAIAGWTLALYAPGPGGGPRIRPDMIGEWFVVSQLSTHPGLAQSLRAGLTDQQATRALSFLAGAADRMESASNLFSEFASGDLRRTILAAAHAAMTGHAGRQLLDTVIARQILSADDWTIDQLTDLDRVIPDHVLLLTHVAIADFTVQLWRVELRENPAVHQADLAMALRNLGRSLDRAGRYQDALAADEEAVTLYRVMAKDNPAVHGPDLARALVNLGMGLDMVGRYQDGLAADEEAVTLYRVLAKDNPAVHGPDLARALVNLGVSLDRVGRSQDALAADEEAVTLFRVLAKDNPAVHRPDLAWALVNLGGSLDRVGRSLDALAAEEEAVTLVPGLAEDNPAVHRPDLATALANLGMGLLGVGRSQDALPAVEEAVTVFRVLAEDNPAVHRPGLATALINLGMLLDRVGRSQDALAAEEEAVTLYRVLAKDNPAVHRPYLATALVNLGMGLDRVGRSQDALAADEEAVTLYRVLAKDNPAVHRPGLAMGLRNLGGTLEKAGRSQDALAADEEAVTLYRVLAEDNPAVHRPGLATALGNLGVTLDRVGRYHDGLSARTESTDIFRELASRDPDLYQGPYQQSLSALRREYDQRGMGAEAILHHLVDPADQPPSPSSPPSS